MLYAAEALDLDYRWVEAGDRQWLVGDAFTVADISLVAYTRLAHEGGFALSGRFAVTRWIASVANALRL